MIDSHCHLTYAPLFDQIDAVLSRAAAAGVTGCVTIGTSIDDTRRAIALAAGTGSLRSVAAADGSEGSCPPCPARPRVWPTAGVHPHEAGKVAPGWDRELEDLARQRDVVAVGETGLDYHYDFADRAAQRRVFERELEIATAVNKPVIIHCREAHADTLAVLAGFPRLRGVVFHCFTGRVAEAREILDRGYWISLTGVVTFKKSDELRQVAKLLPADRLMVETDSPYLSPEPVRSVKPNEPAHLVHTTRCIAGLRGMSFAELDALTQTNTRDFFAVESVR